MHITSWRCDRPEGHRLLARSRCSLAAGASSASMRSPAHALGGRRASTLAFSACTRRASIDLSSSTWTDSAGLCGLCQRGPVSAAHRCSTGCHPSSLCPFRQPLPSQPHQRPAQAVVNSRGAGFVWSGGLTSQRGGRVFGGWGEPPWVSALPWDPLGWTAPLTSSVDGPSLLLRHLVRTTCISDSTGPPTP